MSEPKKLRLLLDTVIVIKRLVVFLGVVMFGVVLYHVLLRFTFTQSNYALGLAFLWFVTAYAVLPHLHRILTKLYIPNYYIGRTRTGDGILGDPINLVFNGSRADVVRAMKRAGWIMADELNYKTTWRMTKYSLLRKSYPSAPVSTLYLFNTGQTMAFQQEIGDNTSKRHHIRFWRTPDGWLLPGGYRADWLAAGTYDRRVGFSLFTLQITHKIAENIDEERDYVIKTLNDSGSIKSIRVTDNFTSAYHTRGGGGDSMKTDGAMPFISV